MDFKLIIKPLVILAALFSHTAKATSQGGSKNTICFGMSELNTDDFVHSASCIDGFPRYTGEQSWLKKKMNSQFEVGCGNFSVVEIQPNHIPQNASVFSKSCHIEGHQCVDDSCIDIPLSTLTISFFNVDVHESCDRAMKNAMLDNWKSICEQPYKFQPMNLKNASILLGCSVALISLLAIFFKCLEARFQRSRTYSDASSIAVSVEVENQGDYYQLHP